LLRAALRRLGRLTKSVSSPRSDTDLFAITPQQQAADRITDPELLEVKKEADRVRERIRRLLLEQGKA